MTCSNAEGLLFSLPQHEFKPLQPHHHITKVCLLFYQIVNTGTFDGDSLPGNAYFDFVNFGYEFGEKASIHAECR